MVNGLTGLETAFVNAASVYQVAIPELQVADKVELCPEHIVVGLAEIPVGVVGVGFTFTVIFPETLLQPNPLTHDT